MVFKSKLTQEQKIDFIYNHLKARDRRANIILALKSIFRIAIIWYAIYFYFFMFDDFKKELINSVTESMTPSYSWAVIEEAKKMFNF